jgi:hypothetical protein
MDINYDKRDDKLCMPIFVYLVLSVYCTLGRSLPFFPGFSETMYNAIRYGLTLILLLRCIRFFNKKAIIALFLFELIFGFSYLYSILTGNLAEEQRLLYLVSTLLMCLPFVAVVLSLENTERLYIWIKRAAFINYPLIVLHLICFDRSISSYSMPASYAMLFCVVVLLNEFTKKSKWKILYLSCGIVGALFMLIYGARGPLFCLAIFIAIKGISISWGSPKMLALVTFTVLGIFLLAYNNNIILNQFGSFLDKNGLYSRTYAQILNNTILSDSGRSYFHTRAIEFIRQNPIVGYGAGSDVKLLGGQYAHSILYEMLFDFGVFIGGGLFLFISFENLKGLFIGKGAEKDLMLILITIGYVMLFFSGTYLQSHYLFIGIALMLRHPVVSNHRIVIHRMS